MLAVTLLAWVIPVRADHVTTNTIAEEAWIDDTGHIWHRQQCFEMVQKHDVNNLGEVLAYEYWIPCGHPEHNGFNELNCVKKDGAKWLESTKTCNYKGYDWSLNKEGVYHMEVENLERKEL